MTDQSKDSVSKQIRNLLLVLFCGIVFAGIITAWMIYQYGPTGRYSAKNVILAPSILPQISYNAKDSKTNSITRFVFDKMEFSFSNLETKKWENKVISANSYSKFYQLVQAEKSLENVPEKLYDLFNSSQNPAILIYVQPEKAGKLNPSDTVFQQIQFAREGDYYRVELREDASKTPWAYFYHPHIYQEIMHILTEGS